VFQPRVVLYDLTNIVVVSVCFDAIFLVNVFAKPLSRVVFLSHVSDITASVQITTPFSLSVYIKQDVTKAIGKPYTRRSSQRAKSVTPIPTTKAKCIEELTLYIGKEGPFGNPVEDQTHEVGIRRHQTSRVL